MRKVINGFKQLLLLSALVMWLVSGCADVVRRPSPTNPRPTITAPIPGTGGDSVSPTAVASLTAVPPPRAVSSPNDTPAPTAANTSTPPPPVQDFDCAADPRTAALLDQMQPEGWIQWVRQLSGVEPVTIAGEETLITSRYTSAMFGEDGAALPNARAFEYVEETLRSWYPPEQIEVQPFSARARNGTPLNDRPPLGKNLILTLPGEREPGEVIILSAHLDSTAGGSPKEIAPGAEDNASGSATLLEAARLLQGQRFERTLRLIWFTGEEQGMLGSQAYVQSLEDPGAVLGVLNLDMFGYDSDNDRCFEIHAGTLPESREVAQCFAQAAGEYGQGLETFDLLTDTATGSSDHGSFWDAGVGAVEILENMFEDGLPGGCTNRDHNPNYHTENDTADLLNPDTAVRIARTALAAVMSMAVPLEPAGDLPASASRAGLAKPLYLEEPFAGLAQVPPADAGCGYTSSVGDLLGAVNKETWADWIRNLSGENPVMVGGESTTILSRYSTYMFEPEKKSAAYDYVREQLAGFGYPAEWIEEDPFLYGTDEEWKNLVLTIPGSVSPKSVVMLTAHLDSTGTIIPDGTPDGFNLAPGADDNATGTAALLEAARVLKGSVQNGSPFASTLRLVWFTGEEQGLVGSYAYTRDHNLAYIKGVVNLDMFGYDSDKDRCFELHVGTLPASEQVGQCFVQSIDAYALDLSYDYLTTNAIRRSDHASFWDYGVGAVEVLENLFAHNLPNGCSNVDANPNYHTSGDTIDTVNIDTSFDITRAALATAFSLAGQTSYYFNHLPQVSYGP